MVVNGKDVSLDRANSKNLLDFVVLMGLNPDSIAIEYNGSIPSKDSWKGIILKDDDRLELVRFVGGG